MQLQRTGREHAGDRPFHRRGNRGRLVDTIGKQDRSVGFKDRANAHRDGIDGNILPLVEEPGIVINGRFGERLQAGPGREGTGWFIECNMPIGADPQDLQIDAAALLDALFVPLAKRPVIPCRAGWDVRVLLWNINVLEKVLMHEVMVAL